MGRVTVRRSSGNKCGIFFRVLKFTDFRSKDAEDEKKWRWSTLEKCQQSSAVLERSEEGKNLKFPH